MTTASPTDFPSRGARTDVTAALGEPALRRYLEAYVRRRVTAADADDLIQSVLCAALEAGRVPEDREELRKWLTGIARRKLAAHYDAGKRELLGDAPDLEASPAPLEASSLMRWAERQAEMSEADRVDETLEWMARESDGEKLETIASEARVPATSVRQRVSRMRRWMKARWVAELAAVVAALLALSFVAWWLWGRHVDDTAKERPVPSIELPRPSPAVPAGSTSSVPGPSVQPSAQPSAPPSTYPTVVSPKPKPVFHGKTPTMSTSKPSKPTGATKTPGTGTATF